VVSPLQAVGLQPRYTGKIIKDARSLMDGHRCSSIRADEVRGFYVPADPVIRNRRLGNCAVFDWHLDFRNEVPGTR